MTCGSAAFCRPPARRLLCFRACPQETANLLPFATGDVPGFLLTRNTARALLGASLGPPRAPLGRQLLPGPFAGPGRHPPRLRAERCRGEVDRRLPDRTRGRSRPTPRPRLCGPRPGRPWSRRGGPVALTQFALDGSPDLGSVLYLEVRGRDRLGFLGSLLRTLARLALSPREMMISTREGEALDRFFLQTVGGQVPPDEARRALARTLEAAPVGVERPRSRRARPRHARFSRALLGAGAFAALRSGLARARGRDIIRFYRAPLAQLDRATDYESVGRTFESCRAHHPPTN